MRSSDPYIHRATVAALMLLAFATDAAPQTLRMHDPVRAKTAQDAVDALADSPSDVFEAMLANVDVADARDLRLLEERNEQTVATSIANLPSWTWSRFGEEIARAANRYEAAASSALGTITESSERLPSLAETLAQARQRSREAAARLAEAEARVAGRLATVAQFRKAVDGVIATGDVSGIDDLDALQALPQSVKTLVDNARASGNATGLQLTLLRLGREIASSDVALAQEEIRSAREEIERARLLVERITRTVNDLERLQTFVRRQPPETAISATILAAAERAHADPRAETAVAETLAMLAVYPATIGYEAVLLEASTVLAASEKQRSSIRRSEISLALDASFVRHGLGGLSSYYAGGLRPADVANLFRALQTIALAVIAGAS